MSTQLENLFTTIYTRNLWCNDESRSGEGSTLSYTKNLRSELPKLFKQFNITSMLDAPCGDFHWMRPIMSKHSDIQYIGADIVKPMIQSLQTTDTTDNQKFIHLDITKDPLPTVDLMMCRDCLFHFEQQLVGDFIRNFANSNIKYLLTTTYYNDGTWDNVNLGTGGFHPIDLMSEPYNFDTDVLYSIEDWHSHHKPRKLSLWSLQQIKDLI